MWCPDHPLPLRSNTSWNTACALLLVVSTLAIPGFAMATVSDSDEPDTRGRTPLMVAVMDQDVAAVAHLLDAGAPVHAKDRLGQTALHLAATGSPQIVRRILKADPDVDARNAGGVTSLMIAAGAGMRETVEMLFAAGARADFKDYQSASAVDWAERKGHHQVAALIAAKLAVHSKSRPRTTARSDYDFDEDVFADIVLPDWFKKSFLDLSEDLKEARAAGKKGILVFIGTRNCSYCKIFLDRTLADPSTRDRVKKLFDVIGLEIFDDTPLTDVDGKAYTVKEFVAVKKAQFTPTMLFYGDGGAMLLRIVGYYPREKFNRVLDYLESGQYQKQKLGEFLAASAATPVIKRATLQRDDKLFAPPPYLLDRRAGPADRPLLVIFERPDCDACERLHERVLSDPSVRLLIGRFQAIQLDTTDTRTPIQLPSGGWVNAGRWARKLGLAYAPAIVFFDESGTEVLRLDSETLRYRMEGALQLVLEKAYQQDAQLQRWRRRKAQEIMSSSQQ